MIGCLYLPSIPGVGTCYPTSQNRDIGAPGDSVTGIRMRAELPESLTTLMLSVWGMMGRLEGRGMPVVGAGQIIQNMQQKTTEELLAIWESNDRNQWSDAAFDAISRTLSARGVPPPPQRVIMPPLAPVIDPRYKGVRGWLLLFCISLTIFNPLSIIASLGAASTSDMFHDFRPAFMIGEILSFIFAGLFIYVGVCLWQVSQER